MYLSIMKTSHSQHFTAWRKPKALSASSQTTQFLTLLFLNIVLNSYLKLQDRNKIERIQSGNNKEVRIFPLVKDMSLHCTPKIRISQGNSDLKTTFSNAANWLTNISGLTRHGGLSLRRGGLSLRHGGLSLRHGDLSLRHGGLSLWCQHSVIPMQSPG